MASHAFAATCSMNPTTHVATVDLTGTISATLGIAQNTTGDLVVGGAVCGKAGPVNGAQTVERVIIDPANCCEVVLFSFINGPLGPGWTDEAGDSDEIEFEVTSLAGLRSVGVFATNGNDTLTAGARFLQMEGVFVQTLNMNGQLDASPDEDVRIRGVPDEISFNGRLGDDSLSANGNGTIGSRASFADVTFADGGGSDTIVGGPGDDLQSADSVPDPADSFVGGEGSDTLAMGSRSASMSISPNGLPDDGAGCPGPGCEGDNIGSDVEKIFTGSGNDTITAGPGDQELRAGAGTNMINAGPGNDLLAAGAGNDVFNGGSGFDTVSYTQHSAGVAVTIGGPPDGGPFGEQDNVKQDIEALIGSGFNDDLTGSAGPNNLFGGGGHDDLKGLRGKDLLDGGRTEFGWFFEDGSDEYFGGAGIDTVSAAGHVGDQVLSIDGLANDLVLGDPAQGVDNIRKDVENVVGGPGADRIKGSRKANRLTGGEGNDKLAGLGGNDRLLGQAGNDSMNGGKGTDACKQGPGRGPRRSCEH
jgi:Ca2+-binding RTX toxin-like protein